MEVQFRHESMGVNFKKKCEVHDGTDFNAAAVKTNLDLCRAAKRGEIASVSSVDVIDTYTVRLNLSQMMLFSYLILPRFRVS